MDDSTSQAANAAQIPEAKKRWFETVVTSTPVLLTVIATFMVGQSSGEMTRAQYYRSVASQNQSKVADQWGFYQAKRIRGQILEGNADLLLAQNRSVFSRASFLDAAQTLVKELRKAEKAMEPPTIDAKTSELKTAVVRELTGMTQEVKNLVAEAEDTLTRCKNTPKNVQAAVDALQATLWKPAANAKVAGQPQESAEIKEPIDADQVVLITAIIDGIKKRRPESEIAPKVLKLTDEALTQAIEAADRRADEVYQRGKSIEKGLEEFDLLVERQNLLTLGYLQVASRLEPLLEREEMVGANKAPTMREWLAGQHKAMERAGEALRSLNARVQGDYKAVRHAYSARRYEDDARRNQDLAYLYEVKVLLASARSDKHLYRSKMFLLAMLVAQAGVTIATLAIAVKRKSIFWALATLTGLIAIGFGAYVYLDLWPMPSF